MPSPRTPIHYLGTSFAAPALSTRLALELTQGVYKPCVYNDGAPATVDYTALHERLIQTTANAGGDVPPLLATPVWQNAPYEDVRSGC